MSLNLSSSWSFPLFSGMANSKIVLCVPGHSCPGAGLCVTLAKNNPRASYLKMRMFFLLDLTTGENQEETLGNYDLCVSAPWYYILEHL